MKVDINLDGVFAKLSDENIRRGRQILANQALADMNQFVPMKEGILRMSATIAIDGSAVFYNMPYAAAQFYGFIRGARIRNYTTPGTSRRWDLRAKAKYMDNWKKVFLKGAGWQ